MERKFSLSSSQGSASVRTKFFNYLLYHKLIFSQYINLYHQLILVLCLIQRTSFPFISFINCLKQESFLWRNYAYVGSWSSND
jgi:hypothetical protein